jgi:glycerol uptake facilitator-like aquaporin
VAPDVVIAASLFLAISLTGEITGGYINPLITIGTWIDKRHRKLGLYMFAQVLGAVAGAFWSWALLGPLPPIYHEAWDPKETLKFVLNEFIGSAFFTVCVLTLTNRYTSLAVKSWQVYLSVPVALFLVRKYTGSHSE